MLQFDLKILHKPDLGCIRNVTSYAYSMFKTK